MKTPELAEDIVESLYDAASNGDVEELFVIYRDPSGQWHAGMATDTPDEIADAVHEALERIEPRHLCASVH